MLAGSGSSPGLGLGRNFALGLSANLACSSYAIVGFRRPAVRALGIFRVLFCLISTSAKPKSRYSSPGKRIIRVKYCSFLRSALLRAVARGKVSACVQGLGSNPGIPIFPNSGGGAEGCFRGVGAHQPGPLAFRLCRASAGV